MKNLMRQMGLFLAAILLVGMNSARAEETVVPSAGGDLYGLNNPKEIRMSYRTVADVPNNEYVEVKVQDGMIFFVVQEQSGKRKSKGRKISDEEIRQAAEYYQKINFFSYTEPSAVDAGSQPEESAVFPQLEYRYGDQAKQVTHPQFAQAEYAELVAWYDERLKEFLAEAYPK